MPRQLSAPFFSDMPVFDRAQYARAVGRQPGDKVVTSMLNQHLKAGNIRRVARGVFVSVPKHAAPETWSVDRYLAASRLRLGGVLGYHSALELHGYAYSEGYEVQVIAAGKPGLLQTSDFTCRFVKPPSPLSRTPSPRWTVSVWTSPSPPWNARSPICLIAQTWPAALTN